VKKVFVTFFNIAFFFAVTGTTCAQTNGNRWVDSVFQTLDTEEKIGQLIMIRVPSHSKEDLDRLFDLIRSDQIGGAIFMQGPGLVSHAQVINKVQSTSKVPMLIGMEATQGLGQSLDSVMKFPAPLVLGALRDDSAAYRVGDAIGHQLKRFGVHINFTSQVNLTFKDAVYSERVMKYSDDQQRVLTRAGLYVNALQQHGVIACLQHNPWSPGSKDAVRANLFYPGLPDTALLTPYRFMIDGGVKGIHTTWLPYFYMEKNHGLLSNVSKIFTSEQVKRTLGFQGLTFTDIPGLQEVTEKPRGGETEFLAFQVGNDILIDPGNFAATIRKFKKSLRKNAPLQQQLDAVVKKILLAKYDAGLAAWHPVDTDNLDLRVDNTQRKLFQHQLVRGSVTMVSNTPSIVPITTLNGKRFATVTIGKESPNIFTRALSKYAQFDHYNLRKVEDTVAVPVLSTYDVVILASFPQAPSLVPALNKWLSRLDPSKVIVCHFGDPMELDYAQQFASVLTAYTDDEIGVRATAQMIFGAMDAQGELPATVNDKWKLGTHQTIRGVDRLSYGLPEEAGMSSEALEKITKIAREAIDSIATPGCYVLVARKGKVVYDRGFGWLTYDNQEPVTDETIYDLASLTKVTGTLQAVMQLAERGQIDVNKKLSLYLPDLKETNKRDIILKDVLTHQSGLLPFIQGWPPTMANDSAKAYYYSTIEDDIHPLQVAPGLYARNAIRDSLWRWTLQSRMNDRQPRTPFVYRYSDIGSVIMHRMVNHVTKQPMESYLQENFYGPLGAYTIGFNPLKRFSDLRIAPTELDTIYRKTLIRGTVHDERAAMVGGVSGHAGIFGTASDLAKIGQMLLNGGYYGDVKYFSPATVDQFIAKQYETSRRGLGWDKSTNDWNGPTSIWSSPRTFGHTGFTGTCLWVDPEFDLVYIFLSNCRFPDRSAKLLSLNIRSRIQDAIYQSIFEHCKFLPE
jgi:CubicO group peptidase (beta-lactamase class C family)/beta-glucosidase-like glycosyl hydrolase